MARLCITSAHAVLLCCQGPTVHIRGRVWRGLHGCECTRRSATALTSANCLAQAISGGLCAALGLQLLQGGAGDGGAAAAALARCGATAFAAEVQILADQLGAVAAIAEAVHGDVFAALANGA
jgi:hypothetical protein